MGNEQRDFDYWVKLKLEADESFQQISQSPHMTHRFSRIDPLMMSSIREWYIKGYLKGANNHEKASGG